MTDDLANEGAYVCVEPEVGRELWRWSLPEATPAERRRRDEHLRICDACRLERALAARVVSGLADGTWTLPRRTAPRVRRWTRALSAGAGGLLAAAVAVLLLLPPAATAPHGHRGDAAPRFLRPVADEVVPRTGATLRWRPLPGATRYDLRVEEADGRALWRGSTHETSLTLPARVRLPAGAELRAVLVPTPRDLALPMDSTVRFRSGGPWDVARYRLRAAPLPARWLGAAAVLCAAGALLLRRRRGGPAAAA